MPPPQILNPSQPIYNKDSNAFATNNYIVDVDKEMIILNRYICMNNMEKFGRSRIVNLESWLYVFIMIDDAQSDDEERVHKRTRRGVKNCYTEK